MLAHRNVIFQLHQRRRLHPHRGGRRTARLPAALPHRRAHLHHLPAPALGRRSPTSPRASRRCATTISARWRPDALLRRAAHLGALQFRHRHPHEGTATLNRPHRLRVGDLGMGLKVAEAEIDGRVQALASPFHALALPHLRRTSPGARQPLSRDRHAPPHPLCAGTGAAPIAPDLISSVRACALGVVHCARSSWPSTRELRAGDRHAGAHQACTVGNRCALTPR